MSKLIPGIYYITIYLYGKCKENAQKAPGSLFHRPLKTRRWLSRGRPALRRAHAAGGLPGNQRRRRALDEAQGGEGQRGDLQGGKWKIVGK